MSLDRRSAGESSDAGRRESLLNSQAGAVETKASLRHRSEEEDEVDGDDVAVLAGKSSTPATELAPRIDALGAAVAFDVLSIAFHRV